MIACKLSSLALLGLLVLIVMSVVGSLAAGNVVPPSGAGAAAFTINANALKPSDCSALALTNTVVGSGTINGTSGNDLILGSSTNDSINGGTGADCIVGGSGNDSINGGNGGDVCIGGPGTDTFQNCSTRIQ